MKNLLIAILLLGLAMACTQEEENPNTIGEVTFKSVAFESFTGTLPNGRISGSSSWKHIFKDEAIMEITNTVTGQEYLFPYNPNLFGEEVKFPLPFGSYSYKTSVEGGAFEKFLPFSAEGEFTLSETNLEVYMNATTDYGLITVKNEWVKTLGIRVGDEFYEFGLLSDESFYFLYAKMGHMSMLEIVESYTGTLIIREIDIKAYNHYNFILKLRDDNGTVNFIELALGEFEYVEEYIEFGPDPTPRLILWNKLGSFFEVENSEIGPDGVPAGEIDFGVAKFGNGVIPRSGSGESGVDFPNTIFNPGSGTVEFWLNVYHFPEANNFGVYGFVNNAYDYEGNLRVFWHNPSSLAFALIFDGDGTDDSKARYISYESFSPNLNEPVHIAVVWDRNGIDDSDETQRIYVNGELVSSGTTTDWGIQPGFGESRIANGWDWDYSENRFAMDNIKVYNYAKTDFSDRDEEGN